MKVKDLISILSCKDQESDVFIQFNGCTESGDMLDITDVEEETFILTKDPDDPDDHLILSLNDYELEESEIIEKVFTICLYSNRKSYEPFHQ